MTSDRDNYCVILAGGVGSRLWPYSRKEAPKQFLDFFGTGHSLLQDTYYRMTRVVRAENILIATNADYVNLVREQLPEVADNRICVEPIRRNTAPVLTWISQQIAKENASANLVVTPSDQLVLRQDAFVECVKRGLDFVHSHECLLTMGVKPTRPDTAYGYIQAGGEWVDTYFTHVKTFTEKPEESFAEMFVKSGEFYWNTGMFLWNVKTMYNTLERLAPDLQEMLCHSELTAEAYGRCPNLSIDLGILERSDNVCMQVCDYGWADLGTWDSLYRVLPKDKNQNVCVGTQLYRARNATGNIVCLTNGKAAAISDLEGYVIAENDKALLICKRENCNDVRNLVKDIQVDLGDEFA
jgi:mannose-1-phosphate guanylyltransferase